MISRLIITIIQAIRGGYNLVRTWPWQEEPNLASSTACHSRITQVVIVPTSLDRCQWCLPSSVCATLLETVTYTGCHLCTFPCSKNETRTHDWIMPLGSCVHTQHVLVHSHPQCYQCCHSQLPCTFFNYHVPIRADQVPRHREIVVIELWTITLDEELV